MDFKRFMLVLAIIATLGFYLMQASELDEGAQWGIVGLLVAEFIMLLFMPGKEQGRQVRRRSGSTAVATSASVSVEGGSEEDIEGGSDLPELVTEESLDGATLKERKMAKLKAKERATTTTAAEAAAEAEDDDDDELPVVEVEVENYHVAEEFVVEVSAQSIEDADIEDTVEERRARHAKIRARIIDRRRSQMAEIRASTAKMWEQQDGGEDLLKVLSQPDHGLVMLEEPKSVEPGHPYGSTFVRIDESRILRLRLPLDSGFASVDDGDDLPPPPGLPALGDLPPPAGLSALGDLPPPAGLSALGDLPPPAGLSALGDLPPPPDLPDLAGDGGSLPPPPPPSSAQSALADLKAEIGD